MVKKGFVYLFALVLPLLVIVAVVRGALGFSALDWPAVLSLLELQFSSTHNAYVEVVDVFSELIDTVRKSHFDTPLIDFPDFSGNLLLDIVGWLSRILYYIISLVTLLLTFTANAVPILNALIRLVIVLFGDLFTAFKLIMLLLVESSPYPRDPYYIGQILQAVA